MAKKAVRKKIDSGILQYAPKGAYYEEKDQQYAVVKGMWQDLFSYDRSLFALISLLNGTGFSKGMMTHMLLANPVVSKTGKELVPIGLDADFEKKIIMYNLDKIAKESMARAIKNLLFLVGEERAKKVNNSRTRKIILEFIFARDPQSLDELAVNYKSKLAQLVRHALGKQELFNVLSEKPHAFRKNLGSFILGIQGMPVLFHLFDRDIPDISKGNIQVYFPKIASYKDAQNAAKSGDLEAFKKLIPVLPFRTMMGFRNTYKLNIEKSEIMGKSKMSGRESLKMESAVKRSGAQDRKVNYDNQELLDLFKAMYNKITKNEKDNAEKIAEAIDKKIDKIEKIDLGKTVIVLDASHSMVGNTERPLHPFLTSLCIAQCFDNLDIVAVIGGKQVEIEGTDIVSIVPANGTELWRGLVKAYERKPETIIVISDGYENTIKGMANHVYKHFKNKCKLIHINPVFSADATSGTVRRIFEDIEPMPVADYKYIETQFIFNQIMDRTDVVKKMLIQKYQKLIGGANAS
jgi:hypothetical protein